MIQSTVGADSKVVNESEDYILVHQPDVHDDRSNDDDDSYDYCEDVFSVLSMGQVSICSEGTDNLLPKEVVLTVPSILLKDLDEAHAAAKLAHIPDLERSEDNLLLRSQKKAEVEHDGGAHTDFHGEKESPEAPLNPQHTTLAGVVSMSRTSNKKRRKKLKLMKKAQAAANAAHAISEKSRATVLSSSAPKKAPKIKTKPSSCRPSRKVSNIAVACATETLGTYRQQIIRNNQQCA